MTSNVRRLAGFAFSVRSRRLYCVRQPPPAPPPPEASPARVTAPVRPPFVTALATQHKNRKPYRKPYANIHTTAFLGINFASATQSLKGLAARTSTPSHLCVEADGVRHWVFDFGAVVSWASSSEHKQFIDAYIAAHVAAPTYFPAGQSENDYFIADLPAPSQVERQFANPELPRVDEQRDRYVLPVLNPDLELALSHALAQSTALSLLEQQLPVIERRAVEVAEYMMLHNRRPRPASLVANALRRTMGWTAEASEPFDGFARHGGALHWLALRRGVVGSTNTPDHFWDRDRYESFYEQVREHLGVDEQTAWIQSRIDQLLPIFSDAMDFKETTKGHRLELAIIALISVEILAMWWH